MKPDETTEKYLKTIFPQAVRRVRKERGWSQSELARKIGRTRQYIHLLENAKGRRPTVFTVELFESVLGPLGVEGSEHKGWFRGDPPRLFSVPEDFRRKFRVFRAIMGWSQSDAAKHLGVSSPTLSGWEKGDRKLYGSSKEKLAKVISTELWKAAVELCERFPDPTQELL